MNNQYYLESKNKLKLSKEALLSFVKINHFLPCPDTDQDGKENRNNDGSCEATVGNLPWQDLGLDYDTVSSFWEKKLFTYHISLQATDVALIQSAEHSESYFGKGCKNITCFDLDTPPTAKEGNQDEDDNLTVKNHLDNNILAELVSVVVIAHNQRPHANLTSGAERDNFENKPVLFGGPPNENKPFDDQFITIHGNEIKNSTGLSTYIAAYNYSATTDGDNSMPAPDWRVSPPSSAQYTFTNLNQKLEIEDGLGTVKIDYDQHAEIEVEKDISLHLYIGNSSNNKIKSSDQDDLIYIGYDANQKIETKDGDDHIETGHNLNGKLDMGAGNDIAYIQQNANNKIEMGAGNDYVYIGGRINYQVDGGEGTDHLYLGSISSFDWNNSLYWEQSYVKNFEFIHFSDNVIYTCTDNDDNDNNETITGDKCHP
jgi:hypothetical protein